MADVTNPKGSNEPPRALFWALVGVTLLAFLWLTPQVKFGGVLTFFGNSAPPTLDCNDGYFHLPSTKLVHFDIPVGGCATQWVVRPPSAPMFSVTCNNRVEITFVYQRGGTSSFIYEPGMRKDEPREIGRARFVNHDSKPVTCWLQLF